MNENHGKSKCKKLKKWWKCENWNEVVWDVIWTARKPEKMFWGAEIEIYRLVMSKGSQGTRKISKWSVCFWISGPVCQRNIVDHHIFDVLVSGSALKVQISLSKISFRSKIHQKSLLGFFMDFSFLKKFWKRFKKFGIRKKRIKKFEICKKCC